MAEEFNPFQSPELPPAVPAYPESISGARQVVSPFASGRVRAVFTMSLLAFLVLCDAVALLASFSQYQLLDAIAHGQQFPQADLQANDDRMQAIVIADGVANLAITVAFLMWVHRVYRNLPALGAPKLEMTPGWAVGWYFVPFANLVKPCLSMAEIWKYSDPDQPDRLRKVASPLVGIWWASFLINRFIDRIGAWTGFDKSDHPTLDSLKQITLFGMVALTIELIAALIAISLIFRVNVNQQRMHDSILARTPSMPPPAPQAH